MNEHSSTDRRALSERVRLLDTESAFDVLRRARALEAQGKSVVHLEIGQPDFPTPPHVVEAAFRAIRDGATGYGPPEGLPILREAIARNVSESRRMSVSPENVCVTPGAKPILFFALLACVHPGDEVIYPDPGFPIYASAIRFAGGVPVPLPLREDIGFRFEVDDLRERISPRTRMVILNSPQNPTGGTLGDAEVRAIAELAEAHDFWVMTDEVYCRLLYGGEHHSPLTYDPGLERTILVDGASKAYSMTGWRLGWGVLPTRLIEPMTLLMVNSNSCTATFTQHAGVAALTGSQECVETMREEFKARRDFLIAGLNAIPGLRCQSPGGAFYAFPNVTAISDDDTAFAGKLLEEGGVATLAGSAFGAAGRGFLRLSYATSRERLELALERIGMFAARWNEGIYLMKMNKERA